MYYFSKLLSLYYIILFSEKCIKFSCLKTAQNLISDINSQNENFVTLAKRLIEVKKENSSETNQYGKFLYSHIFSFKLVCNILFL